MATSSRWEPAWKCWTTRSTPTLNSWWPPPVEAVELRYGRPDLRHAGMHQPPPSTRPLPGSRFHAPHVFMNHSPDSSPALPSSHPGLDAPLRLLALGWADLRAQPVPGLLHGLVIVAFGWMLLWLAREWFWLLAGAFSGFLIVAPIIATGLYHISRRRAQGQ